jgi:hypothetical protein
MASSIPGDGFVTVSERKSIIIREIYLQYKQDKKAGKRNVVNMIQLIPEK